MKYIYILTNFGSKFTRMKKIILLLLVISCLSQRLNKLSAQTDTVFWFAVPQASVGCGDNPIYLRVTAFGNSSDVTISQPANGAFTPISVTVNVNTTQSIDLTPYKKLLEDSLENSVQDKGLLIKATNPVSIYYDVASASSCDIFVLKGRNAVGTNFVIPAQNYFQNEFAYSPPARSGFDIVATENGTTVLITPSHTIFGHAAGVQFNVSLNKGQTYSAIATSALGVDHLYGSKVTSDKPIAITVKDDGLGHTSLASTGCYGWDIAGDQIIPVNILGTEYIVVKGFLASEEKAFIFSSQSNTSVYVGGVLVANIPAVGGMYVLNMTDSAAYINSTKPICVFHISGVGCELAAAVIPPVHCTGSTAIAFNRVTPDGLFRQFSMFIMTRDGLQDNFMLNGNASLITAPSFLPVPGTSGDWVYARFTFNETQLPVGTNTIINTEGPFHLGILERLENPKGSARYGYFSGFSTNNSNTEMSFCEGDSATLEPTMTGSGYLWNDGDTNSYRTVKDEGLYWVKTDFGYCDVRDTFLISFYPIPAANFTPDPEVTSLSESTINFINNSSNADTCKWYFGDGDSSTDCSTFHKYNDDGYYDVTLIIKTNDGCTDTIVKVVHIVEDSLVFTNVFTPNGDGKNDFFEITNIDKYLSSNVVILDRWGKKVYEANNYNNSTVKWEAKGAADGVYYYIVKYHGYLIDGERNGTVTVIR